MTSRRPISPSVRNYLPHTISFPVLMHEEICRIAEEQDRSFSWVVLRGLEKIFTPQEQNSIKEEKG
jgi:hypothetical protein